MIHQRRWVEPVGRPAGIRWVGTGRLAAGGGSCRWRCCCWVRCSTRSTNTYVGGPRDRRVDGFPLSYYPMFSARRGRYGYVSYVVAERGDGSRYTLPLNVLGTGGANQIRRQIYRIAVQEDRAEPYARFAAERVAQHPGHTDVKRVLVVRGKFDLDACLLDREIRGEETVLADAHMPTPTEDSEVPAEVAPSNTTVAWRTSASTQPI